MLKVDLTSTWARLGSASRTSRGLIPNGDGLIPVIVKRSMPCSRCRLAPAPNDGELVLLAPCSLLLTPRSLSRLLLVDYEFYLPFGIGNPCSYGPKHKKPTAGLWHVHVVLGKFRDFLPFMGNTSSTSRPDWDKNLA